MEIRRNTNNRRKLIDNEDVTLWKICRWIMGFILIGIYYIFNLCVFYCNEYSD
ncbi:hypothetical protein RhiirB3_410330 [Rhizophagus irregularis]|nr:hypothetical protein RhiirB3_410330 [Rhizophagus irregularis]